jgi:5-methylcytosine-specific restriction endonuclease McrA
MTVERITGRKLQALRLRIWSADPYCAMCKGLTDMSQGQHGFELDHVVALTNGGTNDDANMQVLCYSCHDIKTNADLGYTPRQATGDDGWPIEQTPQQARAARWRRAAGRPGRGG